ncbi:uncharacterized protein At1g66480-like [Silene latifolia]|uniref:uncharacterized protein At1g66480-like n=1 Tax=Silene latifolia TaxID=37657 RepID=UPI003D78942F
MGNNIGGNSKASAKVMKINGEFFKLKTPTKVIDIIKHYPDHILLDSQDFLRFNLRAKPLDLDFQLQPKKIYLLFEPPKFPQTVNNDTNVGKSSLRRVKSGVLETTTTTLKELRMLMTKRSVSDLSIATKSTAVIGSSHSEGGGGGGGGDDDGVNPVVGPTRVILKLPKAQVKRIMEESNDDAEVAQRIIHLSAVDGGSAVVNVATASRESGNAVALRTESDEQVTEIEVVDKHCFSVHNMCGSNYGRKYKKLSF